MNLHPEKDLTKCEICNYEGPGCIVRDTMVFCPSCLEKEVRLEKESQESADAHIAELQAKNAQYLIEKSLKIDQTIQVQQDIFNAKTVAIHELRVAIENDPEVKNKHFTLAQVLEKRFKHLDSILHELSDKQKDALNEQRAIQTYYNELSKKLEASEREKIKLQDVQYNPPVKKVSPKKVSVKKFDKAAIHEAAAKSGLPEQAIQIICVAKGVSVLEAVRILQSVGAGVSNDSQVN